MLKDTLLLKVTDQVLAIKTEMLRDHRYVKWAESISGYSPYVMSYLYLINVSYARTKSLTFKALVPSVFSS